mgnify:CR=1 FL=1
MITADSPIQSMGMIAGRLMMKKILVCLIVILLIGLLLVGAADARSIGDSGKYNKIESGDLVFIGEKALNVSEKALVVLAGPDKNVVQSAKNIPTVKTLYVNTLNVYDIINNDKFIVTKSAVEKIEEVYC